METTWLDLGPVLVANPMNAGTNVLLAVQCATCGLLLSRHREAGTDGWAAFLLLIAAATGAGAVKHGFGYALDRQAYDVVLAISNVTGGLSTYFAQLATIARCARGRAALLSMVAYAQAMAFLAINLALGPELPLLIANTTVGLVPVIVVEVRAARGGRPGSGKIALGLLVATLAGLVYGADVSLGPWFNHIDLAHAVMALSFLAIARGAATRTTPLAAPEHWSWVS
jgi:hypothetical protein